MNKVTLYHNPRCSKSRQTLALLQERGIKPEIIEYLKTPPTQVTLKKLADVLGLESIVRSNEATYKELNLMDASKEALMKAIAQNPILLQRPIVLVGDKARIGRPPEAVLEILPFT